jgi:hypothetical protein
MAADLVATRSLTRDRVPSGRNPPGRVSSRIRVEQDWRGMRKNAASKARRLLTEGRVDVRHRQGREVRAVVRGDSGEEYEVGHVSG